MLTLRKYNALIKLLAVDRITQLIVEDEITRPIREGVERRWPGSKLSYLVGCKACVSVWAGLVVSVGILPKPILSALAASDVVLLIDRNDERVGTLVAAYKRKAGSSGAIQKG